MTESTPAFPCRFIQRMEKLGVLHSTIETGWDRAAYEAALLERPFSWDRIGRLHPSNWMSEQLIAMVEQTRLDDEQ